MPYTNNTCRFTSSILVNSKHYNDACKNKYTAATLSLHKRSMDELCNLSQMTAFEFNKNCFCNSFPDSWNIIYSRSPFHCVLLTIDLLPSAVGSSKQFNKRFAKYWASPTVNNRIAQRIEQNARQNKRLRTKECITKISFKKLIYNRRKIWKQNESNYNGCGFYSFGLF